MAAAVDAAARPLGAEAEYEAALSQGMKGLPYHRLATIIRLAAASLGVPSLILDLREHA